MKGGRQMETNDSGLPWVVRGADNRLEADYISLASTLHLPAVFLYLFWAHLMSWKRFKKKKKTPRADIGCTLSSVDTDVCLQKVGTNTQTRTICASPKPAAPLPRLERLLTRNLDPVMDKGFPFLDTRNLDKLPQNFEVAKMYNARHHMRNDFQASTLHLNRDTCGDMHFKAMDLFLMCRHSYMCFSAFWLLCPITSTHCFLDSVFPGCAYCVVVWCLGFFCIFCRMFR